MAFALVKDDGLASGSAEIAQGAARNDIPALTGLRGLAALYVMLYHYFGPLPYTNPISTFFTHGYLAVDGFFVLSGFVMAMTYGRMFERSLSLSAYRTFLGRRVARIYPLYFAATIIGFIETARHQALTSALARTLGLNLLMVQVWGLGKSLDGACWSISAEWAAYLLFPLMLWPTFLGDNKRWCAATAVLCSLILGVLCLLPASYHGHGRPESLLDLVFPTWGLPVVRCLCEFMLGIITYRFRSSLVGLRLARSRWISTSICVVTLVLMATPKADLGVVLMFPLLIISVSPGYHLPGRIAASPIAVFIGTISYSIYLVHFLLRGGTYLRIFSLARTSGLSHPGTYAKCGLFLITIPISFLAFKLIEEPGRRFLRLALDRPEDRARTRRPANLLEN